MADGDEHNWCQSEEFSLCAGFIWVLVSVLENHWPRWSCSMSSAICYNASHLSVKTMTSDTLFSLSLVEQQIQLEPYKLRALYRLSPDSMLEKV